MRMPMLGAGVQPVMLTVKNEDTVSIPAGTPCMYVFNGTDDGIAVVLPSTAGANKLTLFAGVAPIAIPVSSGNVGFDVIAFGLVTNAKLTLATRATSTDSFNSVAAVAVGDALAIDTVNNSFKWASSGSSFTGPTLPNWMLAASLASQASSASTTGTITAVTAITTTIKVFLRDM